MKRRVFLLLLSVCLLLGCAACQPPQKDGAYQIYFLVRDREQSGSALRAEPFSQSGCTAYHARDAVCPTPGCLLAALLAPPNTDDLASPFPKGTALRSWAWDERYPGRIRVTLSEQYGGLGGVSLTLADSCIVLTLSQLEDIKTVEIRTVGHEAGQQPGRILSAEEILLDNSLPSALFLDKTPNDL
ncbi:MAG: GerMN domain-containing protein [Clostridium sp.]|nr:GerMN domain-containing protein [Clostridium sp.]